MTTRHVTWKEMADDIVEGNWGQQAEDPNAAVKTSAEARIQTVLLLDIAKSLRALRCPNFLGIPHTLDRTRAATAGLRRDLKAKRRKA